MDGPHSRKLDCVSEPPDLCMETDAKSAPAAIAEVSVYGGADGENYRQLTGRVCDILDSVLDIPADRVYVKYAETEHWGWNGSNF